MTNTIINLLIILLLLASLGYAFTVKRKLTTLMAAIKEIEPLVQDFSMAVDKSENSVSQMRDTLFQNSTSAQSKAEDLGQTNLDEKNQIKNPEFKRSAREPLRSQKELVQSFFEGTRLENGV